MVGTRRTNACATCRERRVKCDEVRPVCGQCAKKNRVCKESLPPEFIWVKSKQRGQTTPAPMSDVDFTSSYKPLSLVKMSDVGGGATVHKYRIASSSNAKKQQRGTSAHGARKSEDVPRSPEMLPLDRLRLSFVAAYDGCSEGLRLSCLSLQWVDIPQYLGESAAMDDAVDCVVRTHQSFVRDMSEEQPEGRNLHFESYHKALMSLQKALNDPEEGKRSTTLCSIAMLTSCEMLGRTGTNHNYVKHAGGVAAFLKSAGVSCVQDALGDAMFTTSVGPVIADAFMSGTSCFLSEPEWALALANRTAARHDKAIKNQLALNLSHLSTLLVDIRTAREQNDSLESLKNAFDQALRLRDGIGDVHAQIDSMIRWDDLDSCLVTRRVSAYENSPFALANWFSDRYTANTVTQSWGMMLHINVIVDRVNGFLTAAGAGMLSEEYVEEKRNYNRHFAEQICSSIEYAQQFSPLGATFMAYPMCIAWGQAPAEWKDWMVQELNTITGPMTHCYTHPILDWAYSAFTG